MNIFAAIVAFTLSLFTGGPMTPDQPLNQPAAQSPVSNGSFELISPPYPEEVKAALKNIRLTGGYQVVHKDKTYVVIGLGQRSTGGYRIVIDGVSKDASGKWIVKAHEVKPQPGAMKIQMISYPAAVIALPGTSEAVGVEMN